MKKKKKKNDLLHKEYYFKFMNLENIEKILKNKEKYRLNQLKKCIFQDLIEDWGDAKTLSKDLREELSNSCSLFINAKISNFGDTKKALITLSDNTKIETVLLSHKDNRNTVCVSSQVGCPMKCEFCATGKMGFIRNLNKYEIIEQVLLFARLLKKQNEKITNIVYMGMGEPFLNYENVIESIKILNDNNAFNIGARKISISTCGITEGILKLSNEKMQINLAISLHAPTNLLRNKLMPVNKKYSIEIILKAVDVYIEKTNRRVMFEYVMIKDVNDSKEYAIELSKLMKKTLYMLNIIKYNETGNFKATDDKKITEFIQILHDNGVKLTLRHSFGNEIKAACGQLATNNK